jgi:hypothetical protein
MPLTTAENAAPTDHQAHLPARQITAASPAAARLLPWVPGPGQVPDGCKTAPMSAYLNDAATLTTARISCLADTAVRLRAPWTNVLGQPPADPDDAREWLRHVGVITPC